MPETPQHDSVSKGDTALKNDAAAKSDALKDDAAARERIETSLDESLIVEAAAGTGKTTQLVGRLVAMVRNDKARIERIVAVTFTRKAAGELKLRLRQALDEARQESEKPMEQQRFEEALARLEEAHIGTIHAFCAELLRQRPVEARVDPAFRELDEESGGRLYDRAFQAWIERRLNDMPPGLRRALSRLAGIRTRDGSSPLDRLRIAGRSLIDWRDFPTPWQRRELDRAALIDHLMRQVREVAALSRLCPSPADYLRRSLEPAEAIDVAWRRADELRDEEIHSEKIKSARDDDALEAEILTLYRDLKRNSRWKGRGKTYGKDLPRADMITRRDDLLAQLEDFKQQVDADLAALLHTELHEVTQAYEELKQRGGYLDFLDLLIRTRDLLRDSEDVRSYLQKRFTHLFVDEFQDTDPLQAEILLLLAAEDPAMKDWRKARPTPGKLFLVGDPKQSIYRFRRADVLLYRSIKERLIEADVGLVRLTRSFRSIRDLQEMVNAAFTNEMTGDLESGQPEYVALDAHREIVEDQPSLVVLPAPFPYSYSRITAWQLEKCQPQVVGAWLDWLFRESGWTVEDPEQRGKRVPIEPRHVALLFRRFMSWGDDVTRGYVSELEARGIPHLLVGGRSFHQREEVETLRAALTAVEWPDDELSVYATLKGALFAISDALLLRFRHAYGKFHPFRPLPEDLDDAFLPIVQALNCLAELHKERNRVPVVDTVLRLLETTRAHAGFALRPAGHQVLANVQHVCDLARSFEARGGLSFRGFVERLSEEADKPGASQAPALDEGAEGVRIMTAHAAKGLEFPVVVLVDLTAKLHRDDPGLFIDAEGSLAAHRLLGCSPWELIEQGETEVARDRAEGVRLAYVSATRARDLLVVTGVGDEPWEGGWLSPLNKAIYPARDAFRSAKPGPSCPDFGDRTVLERPQQFDGQAECSVRPGEHAPLQGEHKVVWWDPALLELKAPSNFGLRHEQILSPDDGAAASVGLDEYEDWRDERQEILEAGSRPEFEAHPVTQLAESPPAFEAEIQMAMVTRSAKRPSGPRFGTLVHTVLRDVDFESDAAQIRALANMHGRVLDATEAEIAAAVDSVGATLAHPLMKRAAQATRQHREAPFVLEVEEGRIVEGTIDLTFLEEDVWTVVDFKTDGDLDGPSERYQQQLSWYLFALERLTGQKTRGVLLAV